VAERYEAEEMAFPALGHWDLVLDPSVPAEIRGYLAR
jgi:hypothetical protein